MSITELSITHRRETMTETLRDIRIVVLQRGWVAVGEYHVDDTEVTITNAHIVRIWGTTRGLGEIAANGPTPSTVLDHAGVIRAHILGVLFTIDCNAEKWG